MSEHSKTKKELIIELKELKQKYDSLERKYVSELKSQILTAEELIHK